MDDPKTDPFAGELEDNEDGLPGTADPPVNTSSTTFKPDLDDQGEHLPKSGAVGA